MNKEGNFWARWNGECGDAWNRFWFLPGNSYPLSLLRIGVGLIAIFAHVCWYPDLVRLFGAGGWLPAETITRLEGSAGPSYMFLVQQPLELYIAHSLGLVVLVAFTAGLWTRVTSVLATIVVLAMVHRAPPMNTQLEPLLSLLMLYLCIGPAGDYLSVDAYLRRRADKAPARPSFLATLALRLCQTHLALLYLLMAFSKLKGDTWWNGGGVWWLITRQESRMIDLTFLASRPLLVDLWTHAVVLFELAFPLLVWHRLTRPIAIAASFIMWPTLWLLTGQTTFTLLILLANLAFLPADSLMACCSERRPRMPVPQKA